MALAIPVIVAFRSGYAEATGRRLDLRQPLTRDPLSLMRVLAKVVKDSYAPSGLVHAIVGRPVRPQALPDNYAMMALEKSSMPQASQEELALAVVDLVMHHFDADLVRQLLDEAINKSTGGRT